MLHLLLARWFLLFERKFALRSATFKIETHGLWFSSLKYFPCNNLISSNFAIAYWIVRFEYFPLKKQKNAQQILILERILTSYIGLKIQIVLLSRVFWRFGPTWQDTLRSKHLRIDWNRAARNVWLFFLWSVINEESLSLICALKKEKEEDNRIEEKVLYSIFGEERISWKKQQWIYSYLHEKASKFLIDTTEIARRWTNSMLGCAANKHFALKSHFAASHRRVLSFV